jgi:hypothetical protein
MLEARPDSKGNSCREGGNIFREGMNLVYDQPVSPDNQGATLCSLSESDNASRFESSLMKPWCYLAVWLSRIEPNLLGARLKASFRVMVEGIVSVYAEGTNLEDPKFKW